MSPPPHIDAPYGVRKSNGRSDSKVHIPEALEAEPRPRCFATERAEREQPERNVWKWAAITPQLLTFKDLCTNCFPERVLSSCQACGGDISVMDTAADEDGHLSMIWLECVRCDSTGRINVDASQEERKDRATVDGPAYEGGEAHPFGRAD